jgi:predicted RNA methylase
VSQAELLLSPAGQELLDRLAGREITPDVALRLGAELRGSYPADLVAAALTQQTLRWAGREKFSRAASMLFTRDGLEQASAEVIARHTAARFAGLRRIADFCCGIGGDLTALAAVAGHVLAVDADQDTLAFALANAAAYEVGEAVTGLYADVEQLDLRREPVDAIFIDPARRSGGRRLRAGESRPALEWCLGLTDHVPRLGIKAAPGIPRELAPAGWELEFVAVGRALREAMLWSPAFAGTARRATILPGGETLTAALGSLAPVPVGEPGEYLLDPNPAVTRAGLVQELARLVGGWQIDPMIAFVAVDREVRTPFARTLRVLESMPWHERRAAARLRELGVGSADIRRRGLAGDVEQIRRRLRLAGDRSAVIVLTRRQDQPWGLICEPAG